MGFSYNITSYFLLMALHLGISAANRIHQHSHKEFDSKLLALQKERDRSELRETWTPAASKQSEEATASLLAKQGGEVEEGFKLAFQEFLGMALFVFFGCGSAMSVAKRDCSNGWILQVALSFGFAIFVLLQSGIAKEINCAVTLCLAIASKGKLLSYWQCLWNVLAQMLGSVTGAAMLKFMFPIDKDLTGDLGTNVVASGWTFVGVFVGEFMGTFFFDACGLGESKSNIIQLEFTEPC
jgi:hypothetical protein